MAAVTLPGGDHGQKASHVGYKNRRKCIAVTLPGGDLDGGLPGHVGHKEVHGKVLAVHQFVHHISECERFSSELSKTGKHLY